MAHRHVSCRTDLTPGGRSLAFVAMLAAVASVAGTSVALADTTTTFDETYAPTGEAKWVDVREVRKLDVVAVGGWGGPMNGLLGGRPDRVSGRVVLPEGTAQIRVAVGGNGGLGNNVGNLGGFNGGGTSDGTLGTGQAIGAGGGGASDVRVDGSVNSRLLVAAGGGGAGAHANGASGKPGAVGGDAWVAGERAPSVAPGNTVGTGGFGGGPGTATKGGVGGQGGYSYGVSSVPGLAGHKGLLSRGGGGGSGATNSTAGGGGSGGGGFFGGAGGGGGALFFWDEGGSPGTGGGGGGGGSSLVPPGGVRELVTETSGEPSVRVTFVQPGTDVTWTQGVAVEQEPTLSFTRDRQPTFTLTSTQEGSTFECRVDGHLGPAERVWVPCATPFTPPAFTEGYHQVEFRAVNEDGNADPTPVLIQLVVDTVAPTTTILSGPAGETTQAQPTFTFQAGDPTRVTLTTVVPSSVTCRFDQAPFGPCSGVGVHRSASALALGPHTFAARATDLVGNVGPIATRAFTVVALPPVPGLDPGPNFGPGPGFGSGPGLGPGGEAGRTQVVHAPTISRLRVRKRIRQQKKTLPRRVRTRKGSTISFTLSERATVRLSFKRARTGRRARKHGKRACVKPTRRNRKAHRCTRYKRVRTTIRIKARKGTNYVVFRGSLSRRTTLRPGSYRLTATAGTAGHAKASGTHPRFRLLKHRGRR